MTKKELLALRELIESAGMQVSEAISQREEYMDMRSEAWLESERAEIYQDKTECLNALFESLEQAIENLDEFEA